MSGRQAGPRRLPSDTAVGPPAPAAPQVLDINENDVCLTLTSGGCNALNLLLHGAKEVVSVDCNPAQSALLELKQVAARTLHYDDFWKLFGEGRHEDFPRLFETRLRPFLSETSINFWRNRQFYFKQGLYYQGGMGKVGVLPLLQWGEPGAGAGARGGLLRH